MSFKNGRLPRLLIFIILLTTVAACGEAPPTPTPPPALTLNANDNRSLFALQPDESEARFVIQETIGGGSRTVVGAANAITGDLLLNPTEPETAEIGVIQIEVKELTTDDINRDRAIAKRVLLVGSYPSVQFAPTAVNGLPATADIGVPLTFEISGDLTITAYTQPITFQATATAVSSTRIEGSASATIQRGDFKLVIPQAPGIVSVDEDIRLEFDFVAEN